MNEPILKYSLNFKRSDTEISFCFFVIISTDFINSLKNKYVSLNKKSFDRCF